MSAYDYLTGNVVDPYDNVGKVRKFGHKAAGVNNPANQAALQGKASIGDLLAQDIYIGGTPGPLQPSKAQERYGEPLTLPPILKGSVSNVNIINGGPGGPYKEEFGM